MIPSCLVHYFSSCVQRTAQRVLWPKVCCDLNVNILPQQDLVTGSRFRLLKSSYKTNKHNTYPRNGHLLAKQAPLQLNFSSLSAWRYFSAPLAYMAKSWIFLPETLCLEHLSWLQRGCAGGEAPGLILMWSAQVPC